MQTELVSFSCASSSVLAGSVEFSNQLPIGGAGLETLSGRNNDLNVYSNINLLDMNYKIIVTFQSLETVIISICICLVGYS